MAKNDINCIITINSTCALSEPKKCIFLSYFLSKFENNNFF